MQGPQTQASMNEGKYLYGFELVQVLLFSIECSQWTMGHSVLQSTMQIFGVRFSKFLTDTSRTSRVQITI